MPPVIQRLKDRKIVQWLLAYLAGAWVAFEVVGQLAHTFGWGVGVERAALVVLCTGVLAALVLAWYHGERGRQSVSGMEILMLSGILVLAAVGLILVRGDLAESTARPGDAAPTRPLEAASIAVLPFENFGSEDDQHFSDGISEEILNVLAQIPGLRVAARTSSFVYRGGNTEITDIAAALGVRHVLEGSIRRSGDRLRITAQLIEGETGFHLWSETYDRALTPSNIFEIQDETARTVGRELQLRVSNLATSAEYQTDDPQAHEEYLRGISLTARGDEASLREAVALLESATRRDPGYVLAWSGLAVAHGFLADAYEPANEAYPRVVEAANRALALAPDLEQALAMRAVAYVSNAWDMDAAAADVAHLDSLHASTPWSQLARMNYQIWLGEGAPACAGLREAARVDPLNPLGPGLRHSAIPFRVSSGRRSAPTGR